MGFEEKVKINDEIIELAIRWFDQNELSFIETFCNTVSTPLGGTHEQGLKQAMTKAIRNFAEIKGFKKSMELNYDDLMSSSGTILSIFIKDPQFQGQTKEKLVNISITK